MGLWNSWCSQPSKGGWHFFTTFSGENFIVHSTGSSQITFKRIWWLKNYLFQILYSLVFENNSTDIAKSTIFTHYFNWIFLKNIPCQKVIFFFLISLYHTWGSHPPRWAPNDLPCLVMMFLYSPYPCCVSVAFVVKSMQQKWRCVSSEIHHMRHCHSALFSWIACHVIGTLQCSHVGKAHMAIWGIFNQHLFASHESETS